MSQPQIPEPTTLQPSFKMAPKKTELTPKTTQVPTIIAEFHLFPKLPTEMRLEIWHLVEQVPSLVTRRDILKGKYSSEYSRPVPAVLHACRESRYEFLARAGVNQRHTTYQLCGGLYEHQLFFVCMETDTVFSGGEDFILFYILFLTLFHPLLMKARLIVFRCFRRHGHQQSPPSRSVLAYNVF